NADQGGREGGHGKRRAIGLPEDRAAVDCHPVHGVEVRLHPEILHRPEAERDEEDQRKDEEEQLPDKQRQREGETIEGQWSSHSKESPVDVTEGKGPAGERPPARDGLRRPCTPTRSRSSPRGSAGPATAGT